MIETNAAGVIVSPPVLTRDFRVDDKNYVYLHFHRLDDGTIVWGHRLFVDDGYFCSGSPACTDNVERASDMETAVCYAVSWVCDRLSNAKHSKAVRLREMIRFWDKQLDLFEEAG